MRAMDHDRALRLHLHLPRSMHVLRHGQDHSLRLHYFPSYLGYVLRHGHRTSDQLFTLSNEFVLLVMAPARPSVVFVGSVMVHDTNSDEQRRRRQAQPTNTPCFPFLF